MRVLVCGSRTFLDAQIIYDVLGGHRQAWSPIVIMHGGARGADEIAARWADANHVVAEAFPADWANHGKGAGPIRNQKMLDQGKPDRVLAFIDKPLEDSRGSADMARRARAAGIPTYVVQI